MLEDLFLIEHISLFNWLLILKVPFRIKKNKHKCVVCYECFYILQKEFLSKLMGNNNNEIEKSLKMLALRQLFLPAVYVRNKTKKHKKMFEIRKFPQI